MAAREEGVDRALWGQRVDQSFRVLDAILKGTRLPDPSIPEQEELGLADFDPELRYRVARDVLEQHYGKARQHMEIDGIEAPLTLVFPDYVQQRQLEAGAAEVIEGEATE